ncbi:MULTISPECIES: response regulator [Hymenobacter]|uniref:Response regulator n=2 Tax=Hymenobacter TaxID=89966 RepID=A0ABS6WW31_9BACT|nr:MULTISPECIES: response regulator [Hymenobacter]MBO3271540.1 response regulator [Hymenobacter defluvii]MBW3127701.1 response regulator [Hymenobacter profundi]QNE38286.1 response regulator [Hymenobacter sp. NBH84]
MSKKLRNIVLVDDNETTSFLNNRLLNRLGVADTIHTFTQAEPAYEFLWGANRGGEAIPELVFVDLKMPGIDGFEFLRMYDRLPTDIKQQTVLTVLTTSMHAADTARVAQYEGVEYLAKPLTEEKMQKLLEKRF